MDGGSGKSSKPTGGTSAYSGLSGGTGRSPERSPLRSIRRLTISTHRDSTVESKTPKKKGGLLKVVTCNHSILGVRPRYFTRTSHTSPSFFGNFLGPLRIPPNPQIKNMSILGYLKKDRFCSSHRFFSDFERAIDRLSLKFFLQGQVLYFLTSSKIFFEIQPDLRHLPQF